MEIYGDMLLPKLLAGLALFIFSSVCLIQYHYKLDFHFAAVSLLYSDLNHYWVVFFGTLC
jgi:hypothetical protein